MADGADYRRVLIALLAACMFQPLVWATEWATTSDTLFPDFFGFWSFGRYVATHVPATIYDDGILYPFQTKLGIPAQDGHYSFLYPPWILLLLAPVGALPYPVARVAWLVATFAGYAAAVAAWRFQRPLAGLLVLAPSSTVCVLVGQNGFLTAALMLGGTRLLPTRPVAAGILLGSLAYKPQLAVLVPFVLLFGQHWRAMAAAALFAAIVSLAATLIFGIDLWAAWLTSLRGQSATLTGGRGPLLDLMPTVTSAVLLLGGGVAMAHLAQGAAVLAAIVAVWRVRARHDLEAQAVLPLATILATPYAFDYDLPMTSGAILAVISARITAGSRFAGIEFPLLLAAILIPAILPAHLGALAGVVPAILAAFLWIICVTADYRNPDPELAPAPAR